MHAISSSDFTRVLARQATGALVPSPSESRVLARLGSRSGNPPSNWRPRAQSLQGPPTTGPPWVTKWQPSEQLAPSCPVPLRSAEHWSSLGHEVATLRATGALVPSSPSTGPPWVTQWHPLRATGALVPSPSEVSRVLALLGSRSGNPQSSWQAPLCPVPPFALSASHSRQLRTKLTVGMPR